MSGLGRMAKAHPALLAGDHIGFAVGLRCRLDRLDVAARAGLRQRKGGEDIALGERGNEALLQRGRAPAQHGEGDHAMNGGEALD